MTMSSDSKREANQARGRDDDARELPKASVAMLSAALAGLALAAAPACDGDEGGAQAPRAGAAGAGQGGGAGAPQAGGGAGGAPTAGAGGEAGGPTGPQVISTREDPSMTYERFSDECRQRGGLVQMHAVCSGNNACKGVSFNKYDSVLTEHTCKAMNTCGGMSCVELPADEGRTGADIVNASCSHCHGAEPFTLLVPPGTDLAEAQAGFPGRPAAGLVANVAFGVRGVTADGVSFASMPPFHETYSLAEIERVVAFLQSSPIEVEAYELFDIGASGAAGAAGAAGGGAGGQGPGGAAGAGLAADE
jgi:Cytochrome C oxidase, cbb3-type, subunit III